MGFKKNTRQSLSNYPFLSIIVCFHNEEKNIKNCIECLLGQDYPQENIEILLVDDRSDDLTLQIAEQYSQLHSHVDVISIRDLKPGFAPKKHAIDEAIKKAKGELLLFTDADGRPGPNWAKEMIMGFDENVGMVIGYAPYATDFPYSRIFHKLLSLEYLSQAAVAAASAGIGYPVTCVATNMAYRKKVYLELGGFGNFKNIRSGDDDLFLQRVRDESNWRIKYVSDSLSHVYNAPPNSWNKFYQQRLRFASKGFYYPFKIFLSLLNIFVVNFLIFIFPFLYFVVNLSFYPFIAGLIIKFTADFLFIKQAAYYLNDRRYLQLFPLAFILHIPYLVYFGIMGQLQKYKWAEQ
jgi:cellulose synthase/poly-beta-1,6-N-acetylglucosamine synthase-like glycosyltransferase